MQNCTNETEGFCFLQFNNYCFKPLIIRMYINFIFSFRFIQILNFVLILYQLKLISSLHNMSQKCYHHWTHEDITLLKLGVQQYGCRWSVIHQSMLSAISPQAIKNKYYSFLFQAMEKPHIQKQKCCSPSNSELNSDLDKSFVKKLQSLLQWVAINSKYKWIISYYSTIMF
jgi:hypothetical protein